MARPRPTASAPGAPRAAPDLIAGQQCAGARSSRSCPRVHRTTALRRPGAHQGLVSSRSRGSGGLQPRKLSAAIESIALLIHNSLCLSDGIDSFTTKALVCICRRFSVERASELGTICGLR
ncbi:hypothetical protein FGB62_187g00 [Gracilaria domingensis]|nr:hypothetical protein FGB62_187g00 [Gracilaria domingensis]